MRAAVVTRCRRSAWRNAKIDKLTFEFTQLKTAEVQRQERTTQRRISVRVR
jgi:hypothetical protein